MKKTTGQAEVSASTTTETTAATATAAAASKTGRSGRRSEEFWCYLGPNLTELLQTGTIFRGTREDALEAAKDAIERFPLVKTLIVSGEHLPQARLDVKTTGTALHKNYMKVAAGKRQ